VDELNDDDDDDDAIVPRSTNHCLQTI